MGPSVSRKAIKDLRSFLRELEERLPQDLVRVEPEVSPANFEVTAELRHKKIQLLCPYCGHRFLDEESPKIVE